MSWFAYPAESEFPIQNLPYGVFHRSDEPATSARPGVAIGDSVLDLKVLEEAGLFPFLKDHSPVFSKGSLNKFMGLGRKVWVETRGTLSKLLSTDEATLRDNNDLRAKAFVKRDQIVNLLPAKIGDYTDFYSSKEHATNLGKMFRPDEEALKPNWVWLPVGYHGRSSSVVTSGTPIRRPWGQTKPPTAAEPTFKKCGRLDIELEMGFFVGPGNKLGDNIDIDNAEESIFGLVLLNDWSARDIQAWEYIPLGPFGGKNLGTTISPWIVTLDALEPFRVKSPEQTPAPLPYLKDKNPNTAYDIQLEVWMGTQKAAPQKILTSNTKYLYWSMKQQLVHHSITGCNMRPGDLLGSGTISGPETDEFGSLIEKTWNGKNAFKVGEDSRLFLEDGDSIILRGFCQGNGFRVGFGDCAGEILPAHDRQ